MSQASIERILGKAMLDAEFRDAFLANPEKTLAAFRLTVREKNYLRRMDAETLDQLATLLSTRKEAWLSAFTLQSKPDQN